MLSVVEKQEHVTFAPDTSSKFRVATTQMTTTTGKKSFIELLSIVQSECFDTASKEANKICADLNFLSELMKSGWMFVHI